MTGLGSRLSPARPFPGLRPYDLADHPYFFGRREQTYALYRLLDQSSFVSVIGDSGSGKSSLVRAGLMPLLERENQEAGGRRWRFVSMRPENSPLVSLSEALAGLTNGNEEKRELREQIEFDLRLSSFGLTDALAKLGLAETEHLLLVVDQFEEIFRYARAAPGGSLDALAFRDEALSFVQILLEGARSRALPLHILVTLRSDFIGDCARFHGLPEAVSTTQFLVPALTRHQREEVIGSPIEKARAAIEPELVQRLLNDGAEDADSLPVLQHCLARLWEQAGQHLESGDASLAVPDVESGAANTIRLLRQKDYEAIGTMANALSWHADKIMSTLPNFSLTVQQIFRALSEVDREGRASRRVVSFAQLVAETGQPESDVRDVVNRFRNDDCCFLIPSLSSVPYLGPKTMIDVGHEALLRKWAKVSAQPSRIVGQDSSVGWLWIEEEDGKRYQGLVAIAGADDTSDGVLPLNQTQNLWNWWTSTPHNEAWTERYGGNHPSVDRLFKNSLTAWNDYELKEIRRREVITLSVAEPQTQSTVYWEQYLTRRALVIAAAAGWALSIILACVIALQI